MGTCITLRILRVAVILKSIFLSFEGTSQFGTAAPTSIMRLTTRLALLALVAVSGRCAAASCDESMTGFFDSDIKSQAWTDIAHGNVQAVKDSMRDDPCYAQMRAADGRGPLFWAHEFDNEAIISALRNAGADENARDKNGLTPGQMPRAPPLTFQAPEDEDHYSYDADYDDTGGTHEIGELGHDEMR